MDMEESSKILGPMYEKICADGAAAVDGPDGALLRRCHRLSKGTPFGMCLL